MTKLPPTKEAMSFSIKMKLLWPEFGKIRTGPFMIGFGLALLCLGCANRRAHANRDSTIGRIEHQSNSYYAALAQGCDVFLKAKSIESNAIYVCESTNLETSRLPSIVTSLKPKKIVYSTEAVSIQLAEDSWIGWNRDTTRTNIWKMSINHRGKERTVYEEPSTRYCLASFGIYDGADNVKPTNRIPHRVGLMYAWKLRIYTREDKVRIKEKFELPGGATWGGSKLLPEDLTVIRDEYSSSGDCRIREFELETRRGDGETLLITPYRVIESDPVGNYKLSLFLDGRLIKVITFRVENE